ncbi:MAG: efflux RND transporter permease subunit [Halothiobacillaceae bacterium]
MTDENRKDSPRLGISGWVAARFLKSEITPLLALVGLLLGLFAIIVTPREEEPQINVTFANVFIPYAGATAQEVQSLLATPAEQVLSELSGVEHVYSTSQPGMAVLTVQFEVGEHATDAIVRLYNQIYSNQDWLPQDIGVGQPIIKPKGIDDVPIVALTLWSENDQVAGHDLHQIAHALEAQLKRVQGTREIYTIGGPERVVAIRIDPVRLSGYGIALDDLQRALQAANRSHDAGALVRENREILVQSGQFLSSPEEVASLVVGMHDGSPVYLEDVADVQMGPYDPAEHASMGFGPAAENAPAAGVTHPAVTIAIGKQPGTNAVEIADRLIERVGLLEGIYIPEGVELSVTRNYGQTAEDKAMTLIQKLAFATAIVVVLVAFALGWREAIIVGGAVVLTLAITLFASWAWGFTLNRVSLFALIFSIGILVDDAIVVVENIHRHMQMGGRKLAEAIPLAVDEVGGPTILATFTVIAALLPMAFVSGLMGPYMSPIPINASMGMLISLIVAFVVTPWMTLKILNRVAEKHAHHAPQPVEDSGLFRFYTTVMGPMLRERRGAPWRWLMLLVVLVLIGGSLSLGYTKHVVLKMLPFDDKSEFQVMVDMPEGTSLERTQAVLDELGRYLATVPEVRDYQAYAGTAAPINFNGLVRQYYLREGAHVGDIQVNLLHYTERDRKSHDIALSVREPLQEIGARYDANVKIVEVPPGPPVQAPIVAEVYGLDYTGQIEVAKALRAYFESTPEIVDIDDSVEYPAERLIVHVDRQKAARWGVAQETIAFAVSAAIAGADNGLLHGDHAKYPIPLRVTLPLAMKDDIRHALDMPVRAEDGSLVSLGELVTVETSRREYSIQHKDLLPVVYVTADMAGQTDSPLYGMFEMVFGLNDTPIRGETLQQYFISQPDNPYEYSIKWDGEWQITYETFRDMGIAYGVGLILIYLLVVAQFKSYVVPLIIMAPIPLTIIGVMPGHALLGAQFTATSMIGMIALAGIIVRNSILLVDFINEAVRRGESLERAVIEAGAVRTKPILLTGLAAMLGAFFILDDPIFSGLAISLIFGVFMSTMLTLIVVPVVYYAYLFRNPGCALK